MIPQFQILLNSLIEKTNERSKYLEELGLKSENKLIQLYAAIFIFHVVRENQELPNNLKTFKDSILILKFLDYSKPVEAIAYVENEFVKNYPELEYVSFFDDEVGCTTIGEIARRELKRLGNLGHFADF
jgi:hypothetical protein